MSDPVWGLLAKAQDDDETIEQAITRLVAVHNDDPESHLAAGQSLLSHKAAEIIDHLAQSVVRDKLEFDRFQIDEPFNTLDIWNITGGVEQQGYGTLDLVTTNVTNNAQDAYIICPDSMSNQAQFIYYPRWELRAKFSRAVNQLAYILMGDPDGGQGCGFKVSNGSLYAVYFDQDNVEQTEAVAGITLTTFHRYKIESMDDGYVYFYVDGVQVWSVLAESIAGTGNYAFFRIKTTTTSSRTLHITNFHFDADFAAD